MAFTPGNFNWAALASLASGNTVGEQLGAVNNTIAAQQPEIAQQQQMTKTMEYLKRTNPQLAAQVEAGMPVSEAWQQVVQAQQPKKMEFKTLPDGTYGAWDGQNFNPLGRAETQADLPAAYRDFQLQQKDPQYAQHVRQQQEEHDVKRGLNPIWGVDANGKRALGTLGEDGSFKPVDLPAGFEPTPGTETIDLGTSIGIRDKKSGAIIQTLPKDVAGVEQQKVAGKTLGDNQAQLPATLAKADQTIKDIDEALTHPGLESSTGWQSVFPTMAGSNSADFEAKLDKLKGGAFLEAFQSLKGGGQITEVEGKKATDAIAVLNTSQSDASLRQALRDLREVISAGKERAARSANVAQPNGNIDSLVEKYRTK